MEPPTRKRSCITRSMTASLNEKRMLLESNKIRQRERPKRTRNGSYTKRKAKQRRKKTVFVVTEPQIELCDLSEEVLIVILENVSAPGLINMSKTSWLFYRLCHTDTLWKHRCKVSFCPSFFIYINFSVDGFVSLCVTLFFLSYKL